MALWKEGGGDDVMWLVPPPPYMNNNIICKKVLVSTSPASRRKSLASSLDRESVTQISTFCNARLSTVHHHHKNKLKTFFFLVEEKDDSKKLAFCHYARQKRRRISEAAAAVLLLGGKKSCDICMHACLDLNTSMSYQHQNFVSKVIILVRGTSKKINVLTNNKKTKKNEEWRRFLDSK